MIRFRAVQRGCWLFGSRPAGSIDARPGLLCRVFVVQPTTTTHTIILLLLILLVANILLVTITNYYLISLSLFVPQSLKLLCCSPYPPVSFFLSPLLSSHPSLSLSLARPPLSHSQVLRGSRPRPARIRKSRSIISFITTSFVIYIIVMIISIVVIILILLLLLLLIIIIIISVIIIIIIIIIIMQLDKPGARPTLEVGSSESRR